MIVCSVHFFAHSFAIVISADRFECGVHYCVRCVSISCQSKFFFVYGYSFLFHFASISRSLHAPVHLFPYTKVVVWCFTLHSHETPKLTLICVIRLGSSKKTWIALKSSLFSSISLDYRNDFHEIVQCNLKDVIDEIRKFRKKWRISWWFELISSKVKRSHQTIALKIDEKGITF